MEFILLRTNEEFPKKYAVANLKIFRLIEKKFYLSFALFDEKPFSNNAVEYYNVEIDNFKILKRNDFKEVGEPIEFNDLNHEEKLFVLSFLKDNES